MRSRRAERGERDLHFQSGKRRAEAVVDTTAKTEMLQILAVGIEPVRRLEHRGIAVSGGDQQHELGALRNRHPRHVDVGERRAVRDELQRGLEAQELFDERHGETRSSAQPLEVLGMAQQRQHPVGDQVDRRLVTGDQQQQARDLQIDVGERFVGGCVGQARQQRVGRVGAVLSDQLAEIADDGNASRSCPLRVSSSAFG